VSSFVLDFPRTQEGVRPVRLLIFGPPGSGKTYLASVLLKPPNFAPKERLIAAGPVPTLAHNLGVPWNNVSTTDKSEMDRFFKKVHDTDEHLFLAIDEFDGYCTKFGFKSQYLYEIVNFDRNFGKGTCAIARGSSDVSTNLIASSDMILWFRTTEQNLLEYIRKALRNFPGGREEAVKTVSTLPKHVALIYLPSSDQQFPGFLKVVNGALSLYPLPASESPEGTESVEPPAAGSSSPVGTGRTSA
jgi:ATPase family associated with various cellular activities (AAA)